MSELEARSNPKVGAHRAAVAVLAALLLSCGDGTPGPNAFQDPPEKIELFSLLPEASDTPANPLPVQSDGEGVVAFAELATFYRDVSKKPDYGEVLKDLRSEDPSVRHAAGRHLRGLLAQSFADESNGRANWKATGFWGGGSVSNSREFRIELATSLSQAPLQPEALPAIRWLLEDERLVANIKAGFDGLAKIHGTDADKLLFKTIAKGHPVGSVLAGAIREAASRHLKEAAPWVERLANHHHRSVRTAVADSAPALGIRDLPPFDPKNAFSPRLRQMFSVVTQMVQVKIPTTATWGSITLVQRRAGFEDTEQLQGWRFRRDEKTETLVDTFGNVYTAKTSDITFLQGSLKEEADELIGKRKALAAGESAASAFSRGGGLSGQFLPDFISLREALVGVWCFNRGDLATAADLLLPLFDAMEDDRWFLYVVRDQLGHNYHQEMLDRFSAHRDYKGALTLARHLSKAPFDGYQYQPRARELAAQLSARSGDFQTFLLPTPDTWKTLVSRWSRAQQIHFLAGRLRLLNCFQYSQPGDIDYSDPQRPAPEVTYDHRGDPKALPTVINPYNELKALKLTVQDMPHLVPHLADENFIPSYGFWRSFHPSRTLHRVNWVVAELINEVALDDIAQLDRYSRLDLEGKKQHLKKLIQWSAGNMERPRKEILFSVIRKTQTWQRACQATAEAISLGEQEAVDLLLSRLPDFKTAGRYILVFLYSQEFTGSTPLLEALLDHDDLQVRFWAALILYRRSNPGDAKAFLALEEVLGQDDGSEYFPYAIDVLLEKKTPEARRLALTFLKEDRRTGFEGSYVLQRLVLEGYPEAQEALLERLASEKPAGRVTGTSGDRKVDHPIVTGDSVAQSIASWRTDSFNFDTWNPNAEERKRKRKELISWLKGEFEKIRKGEKPDIQLLEVSRPPMGWVPDVPR